MRVAFTHSLKTTVDEDQAEFDSPETVAMLEQALVDLGHEVILVEASVGVAELVARLTDARPDLVFNTAEGGVGTAREAFYPALFQRMGLPFTGSDAHVCTVTLDKHLSKVVAAQLGVPVPGWVLAHSVADVERLRLRFPLIVKPNYEGSSMGITTESVVEDQAALERRLAAALQRFPDGMLVEEFVAGRDVVVPFLEAASPATSGVLEPAEYVYRNPGRYGIFELEMKQHGFDDLAVQVPAQLSADQREQVLALSRTVVKGLGVRDLGRLDFRVAQDGQPYFLEMNALPSLEPGASIYLSGQLAGLDGAVGVTRAVLDSAVARWPELAGHAGGRAH